MNKVTVIEIDYYEFEQLVKKTYPLQTDYEFVAVEECDNDSKHTFLVDKKKELNEWEQQDIVNFEAGFFRPYINHIIFQDMVNKDVLEPGHYLVSVCW